MQEATKTSKKLRVNIGCGNNKIEGYLNLDRESITDPDILADVRYGLPFDSDSVEEILFFHTIEHIEEKFQDKIFSEFHRVLVEGGNILVTYPEFMVCAQNYIDNVQGQREFWKHTIYGLQRYPGDYHVTPIDSESLAAKLQEFGFTDIEYQPEAAEPYNSIMLAYKGERPKSYEDLYK